MFVVGDHGEIGNAAVEGVAQGGHLLDELQGDATITAHLPPERLGELLDPVNYTGLAGALVDRVLARGATRSD